MCARLRENKSKPPFCTLFFLSAKWILGAEARRIHLLLGVPSINVNIEPGSDLSHFCAVAVATFFFCPPEPKTNTQVVN